MIYISLQDPLIELANAKNAGTLAIITHIEGPSYRSLGAGMAIFSDGRSVGTLSSGCIEADLKYHAKTAEETGKPVTVRYGEGSKFVDIQLPCGGTLEVTLIYAPDQTVLKNLLSRLQTRESCCLCVDLENGHISLKDEGTTQTKNNIFCVKMVPELRFLVFGKGPEASGFVSLTHTACFPSMLLSPDEEMCFEAEKLGCSTKHLLRQEFPADIKIDEWTAIVLFFHDHDWEPPILKTALSSNAFYIGAQGSKRANQILLYELQSLGVEDDQIKKLKGPIGLIASTRDPRMLAVSVLAEIMLNAKLMNS